MRVGGLRVSRLKGKRGHSQCPLFPFSLIGPAAGEASDTKTEPGTLSAADTKMEPGTFSAAVFRCLSTVPPSVSDGGAHHPVHPLAVSPSIVGAWCSTSSHGVGVDFGPFVIVPGPVYGCGGSSQLLTTKSKQDAGRSKPRHPT